MVRDSPDELVADLEAWQSRFDLTRYLIVLIGGSVINSALVESGQEQQRPQTDHQSIEECACRSTCHQATAQGTQR